MRQEIRNATEPLLLSWVGEIEGIIVDARAELAGVGRQAHVSEVDELVVQRESLCESLIMDDDFVDR